MKSGNATSNAYIWRGWYWKSRVVENLKYLSYSWGKPDAIATVAPTGIAAVLVNGDTVHSKFLINSKSISKERERRDTSGQEYTCLYGMK